MLRLTDIKLPLGHPPEALKAAILKKLKLPAEAVLDWQVFKRGHDARNKQAIVYVYTVDVTLKAGVPTPKDARPTPDMAYRAVATAPATFQRPLVIGAGPCGLFAGLILAHLGLGQVCQDVRIAGGRGDAEHLFYPHRRANRVSNRSLLAWISRADALKACW